jgi:hypothetical protein
MIGAVVYPAGPQFSPATEQRRICDQAQQRSLRILPMTIFPNEPSAIDETLLISRRQIDAANNAFFQSFKRPVPKDYSMFMPVVVGCLDYQFEFKAGHHQTPFIWQVLQHRLNAPAGVGSMLQFGETILPERVVLENWPFPTSQEAD